MNPLLCASLTLLLTVFQAVAVEAKGKKSGSKSKGKKISIPIIAGVIVAAVVVLIILAIVVFIMKRNSRKMNNPPPVQEPQYMGGGHVPGPEKDTYSPYVSTPTTAPPPAPYNAPENQYAPPNQYGSAPSFPVAHA